MSEAPDWLVSLVEVVANCMEAHNPGGPLGYRWLEEDDDDFWEIFVYPTPVELVGGAVDGEIVAPGFSLDLKELGSHFDEVADFNWQAHAFGPGDSDGPNVSIEGTYQDHGVFLRVLSYAPEDEEPGMNLKVPPSNR